MQITKSNLKKIIQEELENVLQEELTPEHIASNERNVYFDKSAGRFERNKAVFDQMTPEQQAVYIQKWREGTLKEGEFLEDIADKLDREEASIKHFAPTGERIPPPTPFTAEADLLGGGMEGTRQGAFGGLQSEPYATYADMLAAQEMDFIGQALAQERAQTYTLPPGQAGPVGTRQVPLATFDPTVPYTADPRIVRPPQTHLLGTGYLGKEDYYE
jgi:hypothetical protein